MNTLSTKLKEVLFSVTPIVLIVLILHFTGLVQLASPILIRFVIGSALIIIGLAIFLSGVDLSISRIGSNIGNFVVKKNKMWIVIVIGLILGFFINFAEPDIQILGKQVQDVTGGQLGQYLLVGIVSVGVGALVSLGLVRIVRSIALHKLLLIVYGVILIFAIFSENTIIAIAFDSSGATTGAVTVPFLLALGAGISSLKKDSKAAEIDSFGLVGLASAGAVVSVIVASVVSNLTIDPNVPQNVNTIFETASILKPFIDKIPAVLIEVTLAIGPMLVIYLVFQWLFFKLPKKTSRRILFGLLFAFLGLIVFMLGVHVGFLDVGRQVGSALADFESKFLLITVAFVLGLVTVLAEPAVNVLTHKIEDVTSGYIKRRVVSIALSLGVGLAVTLSIIRILVPGLQLWHFLLPGFIIALGLTFFVPQLFVGIAFDAGGVATGPMTATFIFAFAQGAADKILHANMVIDGIGVIAMVAMTPIIALQILGLIFQIKNKKEQVSE
ncbi:MAG: DUF1538 domain-containing protein [Clostridiales bacterium]|nr:DUF1538 domain-containing protein [Clostridiales bacterium]